MLVDVFQQTSTVFRRAGQCEISDLSSGIIEVIDVVPEEIWSPLRSYGRLDSHQFDVVHLSGVGSGQMVLVAHLDAKLSVLPSWAPTCSDVRH